MSDEEKIVVEIEDDEFDFDEDEVVDETVDEKPKAKKKSSTITDDLREAIVEIVNEETKDIRDEQAKIAKRVDKLGNALKQQAQVQKTLKTQNEAVLKAMSRLDGVNVDELTKNDNPENSKDESIEVKEDKGIIGKTLGAIGGVAHGIIDTAAFVLESAVDLVTLGNARK